MAKLKIHFNVSDRQSQGSFGISWNPSLDCYDEQAVLNVEGKSHDVTHCELTPLGDRGIKWDDKKEVFFQLDLEDGRCLVGYTEKRQEFNTFMKQWRMMKRNVKALERAKAQAEKEAIRAQKNTSKSRKTQNSTVQTAQALKTLKELVDNGIITQDEYEVKRQALVDQL